MTILQVLLKECVQLQTVLTRLWRKYHNVIAESEIKDAVSSYIITIQTRLCQLISLSIQLMEADLIKVKIFYEITSF